MGLKEWRWPWAADTEHRATQDLNYTETALARQLGEAEGGAVTPDALAAVQAALGLYETVFASTIVEPLDQRTQAITPAVLGIAGRELALRGNAIFRTDIQVGRDLALIPATSFVIRGSAHPRDWRYSVSLNGPTETRFQENVEADGIIHFRLRASAYSPWLGRSVLSLASATSTLASKIEKSLTREQSIRPSRMIHTDLLADELQAFITDVTRGGFAVTGGNDDQTTAPNSRQPHKIGPAPDIQEVSLRSDAAQSVLAMFGIPPSLFFQSGDSDARESWRRFVLGTMNPMLRVCEAELRIKLIRPELTLSLEELKAADLQSRARALAARSAVVRNLVTAGVSVADAREAAGI